MYMGGEKLENGKMKSYLDYTPEEVQAQFDHEHQAGCKTT